VCLGLCVCVLVCQCAYILALHASTNACTRVWVCICACVCAGVRVRACVVFLVYLLQGGVRDAVAAQLQGVQVAVQGREQRSVGGGAGGGEGGQCVHQVTALGLLQARLGHVGLDEGLQLCVV
jgi:hypothetical protein